MLVIGSQVKLIQYEQNYKYDLYVVFQIARKFLGIISQRTQYCLCDMKQKCCWYVHKISSSEVLAEQPARTETYNRQTETLRFVQVIINNTTLVVEVAR